MVDLDFIALGIERNVMIGDIVLVFVQCLQYNDEHETTLKPGTVPLTLTLLLLHNIRYEILWFADRAS